MMLGYALLPLTTRRNNGLRLRLLYFILVTLILGCARQTPPRPELDPANPSAPSTPSTPVQLGGKPFAAGVMTGAVLIGEPQGRSEKESQGGMMHGAHGGMMHGADSQGQMPGGMNSVTTTAAQQYTCPMHPEVVQDHPGKCPKCGMDLIPRSAQAGQKGAQQ